VRLFPNHRGARFEGSVHELVNQSLERNGVRIADCAVPIHHYPYTRSVERIQAKQELYLKLGRRKAAAHPNDPKAYAELGNQYAEVGEYAQAAAAYGESLRLNPSNPIVLKDLGGMLHLLKRNEGAKQALRLALQFDPRLAEAWRNLGVISVDERRWVAAVAAFGEAMAIDPSWSEGHRYLSVALQGAGRLEEASEAARKALFAHPDSKEAVGLYIHQMLRLERRDAARQTLHELIDGEMGVINPELHNALGELYCYDNLFEEAKAHFRQAAAAGLASGHNNAGVVLFREGRYAEAREAFEQCLKLNPGDQGARRNLDKVLKHMIS
jgi:tetratricopeptide (TPR) repeat protein